MFQLKFLRFFFMKLPSQPFDGVRKGSKQALYGRFYRRFEPGHHPGRTCTHPVNPQTVPVRTWTIHSLVTF
jgi:hypothetical protein